MSDYDVGSQLRQHVYTVMGECIGCLEVEVCQSVEGSKMVRVTDSHGGVGFIKKGAFGPLEKMIGLTDDQQCRLPEHKRYKESRCADCWFGPPNPLITA